MSYRNLKAWGESLQLVKRTYQLCESFPNDEKYILVSQMKRACISVCSNIAEGNARGTYKDKSHFFIIANSSLHELESQAEIAAELGYIKKSELEEYLEYSTNCHMLLSGLIKFFKKNVS